MLFKDLDKEPQPKKHFIGIAFEGDPDVAINLICAVLKKMDYVSVPLALKLNLGVELHARQQDEVPDQAGQVAAHGRRPIHPGVSAETVLALQHKHF